jgi:hypothetical protein
MTSCMRSSRALNNPPVLIVCSLRLVSSGLVGRLGIFRSFAPRQR